MIGTELFNDNDGFVDIDTIVAQIEIEEEVEEFLKTDKENEEWN